MSIALAQQTNYVYTPRATFNWTSRNLNYIIISYFGNTDATSTTIFSAKLTGQSFTTPDLSLNTLYTFVFTPYNSAGGGGNPKTITLDTSPAISNANIINATGTAVTFQWFGTYSYVKVLGKLSTDVSYSDLSTNITSTTYSYYGIAGNTDYTFYVTPYGADAVAGASSGTMSVKTGVQPAKNLATTYVDNSAVIVSFTEPVNYCNTYYYTFRATDVTTMVSFDVSSTSSPMKVGDLSGNTEYSMSIITTLNEDSTSSATSNYISATTNVQAPASLSTPFYDSSAIQLSFIDGRNTYNSVYYVAYATDTGSGVVISASGSSIPVMVSNLSGNTTYNLYVKNVLNGNTLISATSLSSAIATTKVQPVTTIGNTYIDGSAIAISFVDAKNTYSTRVFSIAASDLSGTVITTISGAQPGAAAASNIVYGLNGNTPYFFNVTTTLNGNSALSATSVTYYSRTYVQAPINISVPFYDSSSIDLSFSLPANSYTTTYYYDAFAYDGIVTKDVSGNANVLSLRDLSSNTDYTCYVRTYVTSRSDTISFTTANRAYIPGIVMSGVVFT